MGQVDFGQSGNIQAKVRQEYCDARMRGTGSQKYFGIHGYPLSSLDQLRIGQESSQGPAKSMQKQQPSGKGQATVWQIAGKIWQRLCKTWQMLLASGSVVSVHMLAHDETHTALLTTLLWGSHSIIHSATYIILQLIQILTFIPSQLCSSTSGGRLDPFTSHRRR